MMRTLQALLLLVLGLVAGPGRLLAACDIVGVQSVTPATLNVGTYTSTTLPPAATITVSVTLLVSGNGGGCKGEYGLVRTVAPARMSMLLNPVTLPYNVTSNGGAILSYGLFATQRRRLPNFNVPNGSGAVSTATISLSFTIQPQTPVGVPSAGAYSDQLLLQIFNREQGNAVLVGQAMVTVAAQVIHSCNLSAPSALSLDFSSDVATGSPAGNPRVVSFNVNCTGPSRVRLTGSALVAPASAGPSGAFDNFINYRASASFGGAAAQLQTNGTAPVTVTSSAASALSGSNLPVNVDIRLLAGRPLIGRTTYTGVLRVTVDPAF